MGFGTDRGLTPPAGDLETSVLPVRVAAETAAAALCVRAAIGARPRLADRPLREMQSLAIFLLDAGHHFASEGRGLVVRMLAATTPTATASGSRSGERDGAAAPFARRAADLVVAAGGLAPLVAGATGPTRPWRGRRERRLAVRLGELEAEGRRLTTALDGTLRGLEQPPDVRLRAGTGVAALPTVLAVGAASLQSAAILAARASAPGPEPLGSGLSQDLMRLSRALPADAVQLVGTAFATTASLLGSAQRTSMAAAGRRPTGEWLADAAAHVAAAGEALDALHAALLSERGHEPGLAARMDADAEPYRRAVGALVGLADAIAA